MEFRMKILSCHKSAFERQLREAVVLDHFAGPTILNSKMEYTRCGIPKIELKVGNKEKLEDPAVTREKAAVEMIKLLYKGENKRSSQDERTSVVNKKRKMEIQVPLNDNQMSLVSDNISWVTGPFSPLNLDIDSFSKMKFKSQNDKNNSIESNDKKHDLKHSPDLNHAIEQSSVIKLDHALKQSSMVKLNLIGHYDHPSIKFGGRSSSTGTCRMVGWTNNAQHFMPPPDRRLEATKICGRTVSQVCDNNTLGCRSFALV